MVVFLTNLPLLILFIYGLPTPTKILLKSFERILIIRYGVFWDPNVPQNTQFWGSRRVFRFSNFRNDDFGNFGNFDSDNDDVMTIAEFL